MDPKAKEAFSDMVQQCLNSVDGQTLVKMAKDKLLYDFESSKFNTMQAEEVLQKVIRKVIRKKLSGINHTNVKRIKNKNLIKDFAQQLTMEFKENIGAYDQRPVHRGLIAKIIGK